MKRPEKSGLGRFATESAVIVGSILLAFAIDAWWSDRIDRRVLVEQLESVEAELVTNLEATESRLEILGHRILLTNQVLLALSNDEIEISQSTFMSKLGEALIFGRSLRNRHNSIEALKSSSRDVQPFQGSGCYRRGTVEDLVQRSGWRFPGTSRFAKVRLSLS